MSVFLGWMPHQDTHREFAKLCDAIALSLPVDAPAHDWHNAQQWHMTVRYLGKTVHSDQEMRIREAAGAFSAHIPAIATKLHGVQYWPHASVLVARVEMNPALQNLFEQTEQLARTCGFTAESRKPSPHVTLAYLPKESRPPALTEASLEAIHDCLTQPILIDRLQLLRTRYRGYDALAAWSLLGNRNDT